MAKVSMLKALSNYFNTGEGKVSMAKWQTEIKALSADEKRELAEGVCAITGDELS
jgi:hypothetical protein